MNYPENKLPELLAPAGSIEHLKAAVLAGADAVYFGGSRFGARAFARNFDRDSVIEALNYLHFHDRRGYMTVNTLIKEKELQTDLYEYLLPFYEAGLDGVIVQDLGAASFIHEHFPEMEIHGSTQMMITGIQGALAAKEMGMNRIVPARELSREELMAMKDATGLELEVFIHGALCYAYSGQCLLSSTYGGRSGNRGRCAQPCRLPYKAFDHAGRSMTDRERHLLSPRDLYALRTLPSMVESGVDSLKVEGRMKNVEYVAGVISVYRRYLDLCASDRPYRVEEEDLKALEELYVRTAFTDGYWRKHNGPDMMSVDTPRHVGRKLGKINAIRKNRLYLELTDKVSPRDLLIIPGKGEDELALTVPRDLDSVLTKKKHGWSLILNAPRTPWLRPGMTVFRRHNEDLNRQIEENILKRKISYPVEGEMTLRQDEPIVLRLRSRGREIEIEGPKAEAAQKSPVTDEDILRQMGKTGDVPYDLTHLSVDIQGELFLPASSLKEFRRRAYDTLQKEYIDRFHREIPSDIPHMPLLHDRDEIMTDDKPGKTGSCYALVYEEEILDLCLGSSLFEGLILSMDHFHLTELVRLKKKTALAGKKVCLSLPRVLRYVTPDSFRSYLEDTVSDGTGWDAVYLHHINEYGILPDSWKDIPRVFTASNYCWNSETVKTIRRLDCPEAHKIFDMPLELSVQDWLPVLKASGDILTECLIYGRYPVMMSAQCVKNTLNRCDHKEGICHLEDPRKRRLPMSCHCRPDWTGPGSEAPGGKTCYNMIWTDVPRNLIGEDFSLLLPYTHRFRFDFFGADPEEVRQVADRYRLWEETLYKKLKTYPVNPGSFIIGTE